MKAIDVKSVLFHKGVTTLYHVNSVATALTFINNGGLLSRGAVEDMGLAQTPQATDVLDKNFGIYHDVFFDSVDIHSRAKKINDYGPVVFVYDIGLLGELGNLEVKVTKQNPKYWDDTMTDSDKYFENITELNDGFHLGDFAQEITICNTNMAIGFEHLKELIIDNPEIDNTSYFDNAVKAITNALDQNGIMAPLAIRKCPEGCKCKEKYMNSKEGYTYYRFRTTI